VIVSRGRLAATVELNELGNSGRSLEDLYLELTTKEMA